MSCRRKLLCSSFMKWIYACLVMSTILMLLLYDASQTYQRKYISPKVNGDMGVHIIPGKVNGDMGVRTIPTAPQPAPTAQFQRKTTKHVDVFGKINGVEILGEISGNYQYAVYGATTQSGHNFGHAFYLPLTAKAWNKVGFRSIVILIGSVESWHNDQLSHHVISHLRQENATIVFMSTSSEHEVTMSQVGRIFIANILKQNKVIHGNPYLITSDADMWPLEGTIYNLPTLKEILSLNSECCGRFLHAGKQYKMLPMANIGMKLNAWVAVTIKDGMNPAGPNDIVRYLYREFGDVALHRVEKGENLGWYLDQQTISVLIQDYTDRKGNPDIVHYVARDTGRDRVDRSGWDPRSFGDKVDAHLPENPFLSHIWGRLMPLLNIMHNQDSQSVNWCIQYFQKFQDIMFSSKLI